MLLPLGVFFRYHLRRGIWTATGAGLGTSLLFELTQGTALWGAYPCPYRLFDVDDLLINTAGATLGWVVAGPLARLLPTLDALDERVSARRPVPFGRRLVALLVDLTAVGAATALGVAVLVHNGNGDDAVLGMPLAVFTVWFLVLPWLTGATPASGCCCSAWSAPTTRRPRRGNSRSARRPSP
ncbi:VanZ family protein [Streptomyces sp. M19]